LAGTDLSGTMKLRSYEPSATEVVAQSTLHGALVRVPIERQSSAPAAEYWNSTDLIPERALGSAPSVTVPRRYAPGSVGRDPGGLPSIRTSVALPASTFPAASVEKYEILCEPSFAPSL